MASSETTHAPGARQGDRLSTHRRTARAGLLAFGLLLTGCSLFEAPAVPRGNRADPDLIAQLQPGVQGKADVQALLGPPSATGTFDDQEWYYISSITRIRPAQSPGVSDQRVVVFRFDPNGMIQKIDTLGPQDMRDVNVVQRTTPVPGTERTLLQALFGNIGRVGANGMGMDSSGPGGGPGR